jgi:tetratricopeptide (TPR) repeat protein
VRLDEAVDLIQRALLEEPHNGSYLDSLGWAYFKQNKLEDAEKTLRRALGRNRHDPTIHDHLGDVLARQGHAEQAAAAWERSLAEWQRATPAELEPEKIAATETKLRNFRNRIAQKKPAGETRPQ